MAFEVLHRIEFNIAAAGSYYMIFSKPVAHRCFNILDVVPFAGIKTGDSELSAAVRHKDNSALCCTFKGIISV